MKFKKGDTVVVKRVRDWFNDLLYSEDEDKHFIKLSPFRIATVVRRTTYSENVYIIGSKSLIFNYNEFFKCSEDDMILVEGDK